MRSLIIIGITLFILQACSTTETSKNVDQKRVPKEQDIVQLWYGKNVRELVEQYGKPDLVINTTLKGRPASEGYVYESNRLAGIPNCTNVYVVIIADKHIDDYFCR